MDNGEVEAKIKTKRKIEKLSKKAKRILRTRKWQMKKIKLKSQLKGKMAK